MLLFEWHRCMFLETTHQWHFLLFIYTQDTPLLGVPNCLGTLHGIGNCFEKMTKFQAKLKFGSIENENRKLINNLPGILCSNEP
jgi:hypothetical protein